MSIFEVDMGDYYDSSVNWFGLIGESYEKC